VSAQLAVAAIQLEVLHEKAGFFTILSAAMNTLCGYAVGITSSGVMPMRSVRQLLNEKSNNVVSLGPDEPVIRAIQLMAEHGIGSVLVMEGDEIRGIATERDYARKVILQNRSSREIPICDIMSTPVITVQPESRAHECMQMMTEKRIRHLPWASCPSAIWSKR
jgi:predicted transcriptional regulator